MIQKRDQRWLDRAEGELVRLAADVAAARTAETPPASAFQRRAREMLELLNRAEAEHITLGLEGPDFPFEAAQAELGHLFLRLARLAREIADTYEPWLASSERADLREVAHLVESLPPTSLAGLATIRRNREDPRPTLSHAEARAATLAAARVRAAKSEA